MRQTVTHNELQEIVAPRHGSDLAAMEYIHVALPAQVWRVQNRHQNRCLWTSMDFKSPQKAVNKRKTCFSVYDFRHQEEPILEALLSLNVVAVIVEFLEPKPMSDRPHVTLRFDLDGFAVRDDETWGSCRLSMERESFTSTTGKLAIHALDFQGPSYLPNAAFKWLPLHKRSFRNFMEILTIGGRGRRSKGNLTEFNFVEMQPTGATAQLAGERDFM